MDAPSNVLYYTVLANLTNALFADKTLQLCGIKDNEQKKQVVSKVTTEFQKFFNVKLQNNEGACDSYNNFSASLSIILKNEKLNIKVKTILANVLEISGIAVSMISAAVNEDIERLEKKTHGDLSQYNEISIVKLKLEDIKNKEFLTDEDINYCTKIFKIYMKGTQVCSLKTYGRRKDVDSIKIIYSALDSALNAHDDLGNEIKSIKRSLRKAQRDTQQIYQTKAATLFRRESCATSGKPVVKPTKMVSDNNKLDEKSKAQFASEINRDIDHLNLINYINQRAHIINVEDYNDVDRIFEKLKLINSSISISAAKDFYCFHIFMIFHDGINLSKWRKKNKNNNTIKIVLQELKNTLNAIPDDRLKDLSKFVKRKLNKENFIDSYSSPVISSP